ncbi:CopG family antitoxin [Oscillatoria salina]|uniref:CopG family antitoxin n=1 Tax=Oscillatoria salina TaxID=331517 RepID=UPI0013BE368B|nr:CopG family antitoxin [Oscillatoria salina]MBZ8179830.1 hypothetical protein [Oscillatoria salina IIICB1]NET88099.1 hypothetical protein [Kamptonema sp. SIO1D9]
MNDKQKQIDPISNEFTNYEEAAEFWDNHDTTDYLEDLEDVTLEAVELKQRHFEIEIEVDLMKVLSQQAQHQGVGVSQLVSKIIRERFADEVFT